MVQRRFLNVGQPIRHSMYSRCDTDLVAYGENEKSH